MPIMQVFCISPELANCADPRFGGSSEHELRIPEGFQLTFQRPTPSSIHTGAPAEGLLLIFQITQVLSFELFQYVYVGFDQ